MARSKKKKKKKSISQTVVDAGTSSLPEPVRKVLGMRIIAGLIVLAFPLLLVSGVIDISFDGIRPHLSINKEKSHEVEAMASETIHEIRGEDEGFLTKTTDSIESLFDGNEDDDSWLGTSDHDSEGKSTEHHNGPLAGLKERLDSRR